MKGFVHRVSLFLGCVALCTGVAFGQTTAAESGVPGDGIPDFYYSVDGSAINTSLGTIATPTVGAVYLDTDGNDAVAFFVGGDDVSTNGCELCDGENMPGVDAISDVSEWTVGAIGGSTQWIRSSPLSGRGFAGVATSMFLDDMDAAQPWPMDVEFPPGNIIFDFPGEGLGFANYGPNAMFDQVLDDGLGEATWSAQMATNSGAVFYTNVTPIGVPEPTALGLLSLAVFGLFGMRRS